MGLILRLVSEHNSNGYDITLQNYFADLAQHLKREIGPITRAAFCLARKKLRWQAFSFLLTQVNEERSAAFAGKLWKKHVIRAVDTTYVTLPCSKQILREFPQHLKNGKHLVHYPTARLTTAVSLVTGQPIDARLMPYTGNDRRACVWFLRSFKAGDLCLLDRGFDGFAVMHEFERRKQYFLIRARVTAEYVRDFLKTEKTSAIIVIDGKTYSGKPSSLRVRIVKSDSWKGKDPLILITNLINEKRDAPHELLSLYLRRWEIETVFNRLKNLFCMEKFHARSPNGIRQEIFAHLIWISLAALATTAIEPMNPAPQSTTVTEGKKMSDKIEREVMPNFKATAEALKRAFFLFVNARILKEKPIKLVRRIIQALSKLSRKRQPGRHYPRISNQPQNTWTLARPKQYREFRNFMKGIQAPLT